MKTDVDLNTAEYGDDPALVRQARDGSDAAFDILFERHQVFVFNVCYRMLGSRDDAKDALQTTFLNAYRGLGHFKEHSTFRSWLYRIAINVSTQILRQRKRRWSHSLQENTPAAPSESTGDLVWEAVLELPANLRAVLVLFYFQDLSNVETAEALGCSQAAVRVRLHRARAAFRKKYEELAK